MKTITLYLRKKKGPTIFFIVMALIVGFIFGRVTKKTEYHTLSELDPPPMPKIQSEVRPNVKSVVTTNDRKNPSASLKNIGYINIETQPTSAEIYIDNQRLAEKVPVIHYPIPAEKPIKVKAINTAFNTFDEQTVQVHTDTTKTVILYLKKNP